MSDLKGQGGELRATIQVTRAATGMVETYELIGGCSLEEAKAQRQSITLNRRRIDHVCDA